MTDSDDPGAQSLSAAAEAAQAHLAASLESVEKSRADLERLTKIAETALAGMPKSRLAQFTGSGQLRVGTDPVLRELAAEIKGRLDAQTPPATIEVSGTVSVTSDTHLSVGVRRADRDVADDADVTDRAEPLLTPGQSAVKGRSAMPGPVVTWTALVLAVQDAVEARLPEESREFHITLTLALVALLFAMIFDDRPDDD